MNNNKINEKLVLYGSLLYFHSDRLYCQSDITEQQEIKFWNKLATSLGFKEEITPKIVRKSPNTTFLRNKSIDGEKPEEALTDIINAGNWKHKENKRQTKLIEDTWQKIKKELNFSLKPLKPKPH